jgi:hypothetical protein
MISQDGRRLVGLIRAQFGLPDLIAHLTRLLAASGKPATVEQAAMAGRSTQCGTRSRATTAG